MLLAVNQPVIQDKAYKEIERVIGTRNPRGEDRPSMPFTQGL